MGAQLTSLLVNVWVQYVVVGLHKKKINETSESGLCLPPKSSPNYKDDYIHVKKLYPPPIHSPCLETRTNVQMKSTDLRKD